MPGLRSLATAIIALSLLSQQASAMRLTAIHSIGAHYLQESGAGAPLGKLNVPEQLMEGHCITMVSPTYPQGDGVSRQPSTVVVRVVIWKSGSVYPMRVVSGDTSLEAQAMDAVRLWHYKPFLRDGEPMDVSTDIRVDFDPQKPGGVVTHPHH
jgi:TonB family protein